MFGIMEITESSTNWESLFEDLDRAECDLDKNISLLVKSSDDAKFIKIGTGYKSDEWRNLHSLISKNGKTIEKVTINFIDMLFICVPNFNRFIQDIALIAN